MNSNEHLSQAMREAQEPADIDRLLADEPWRALKLSSAAAFRRQGSSLVRDEDGKGWEDCATRELNLEQPMLAPVSTGLPFGLEEHDDDGIDFPPGLRRPVLAVPAADPVRCFALSLYGPHAVGTDLDANERAMLYRLACFAALCTRSSKPSSCATGLRRSNGSSRRRAGDCDSTGIKTPANVRFGSLADTTARIRDVRFTPKSGRAQLVPLVPQADIRHIMFVP